jgi:hypothetical protein
LGWKKRQEPVLFTLVEVLEWGTNNGIWLKDESFIADSFMIRIQITENDGGRYSEFR